MQVYCKYHKPGQSGTSEGCKQVIKLKEKQSANSLRLFLFISSGSLNTCPPFIVDRKHEAECDYSPISCPNSPDCPPLLRMEIKEHLKKCPNTPCDHAKHG